MRPSAPLAMLGSAVSSKRPTDFQPSPVIGVDAHWPATKRQAPTGVQCG